MPQKQDAGVNSQMVEDVRRAIENYLCEQAVSVQKLQAFVFIRSRSDDLARAALAAIPPDDRLREAALRSALERLDRNFDLLLRGKPVRDVAETKAEVTAALSLPLNEEANGG